MYVKLNGLEAAGKAFKVLHGWWFDGRYSDMFFPLCCNVSYLGEQFKLSQLFSLPSLSMICGHSV